MTDDYAAVARRTAAELSVHSPSGAEEATVRQPEGCRDGATGKTGRRW